MPVGHVRPLLDAARLVHDLQQVKDIAQTLSGQLDPTLIARQVTEALVQRFDCAFARIWLLEPDQVTLRLVASSGLYTHLDGAFARVPVGAYKVGKIAQNQVPFLSNHLPQETWVKDRQWAIANGIQGFAGYPLAVGHRVLGVLASFSHGPFAPEFLEVLQVLCMTVTVALDAALTPASSPSLLPGARPLALSDHLAQILGDTQLTLVGTERPLRPALAQGLLQAAETLRQLHCRYCRLSYTPEAVHLEAIATIPPSLIQPSSTVPGFPCQALAATSASFGDLKHWITALGGSLESRTVMEGQACQLSLELPAPLQPLGVQVYCRQPWIHHGLTQLLSQGGFRVVELGQPAVVRVTNDPAALGEMPVLWVRHNTSPVPTGVAGVVDLEETAEQLRNCIDQILQGSLAHPPSALPLLSERERQVMHLLAEGQRDRAIAQALYISESTVKFHINNCLTKLKAKNRYQGVYQAVIQGWI